MLDKKYNNFSDYVPKSVDMIKNSTELLKSGAYKRLFNIFEEPISKERVAVDAVKYTMLGNGAKAAMMSGSGPSVFGVFENESDAEKVVDALRRQGFFACVAYPVSGR